MKCQILRSRNSEFFVRVVASNGRTLAHSETYTSKTSAERCAGIIAGGGTVEDLT